MREIEITTEYAHTNLEGIAYYTSSLDWID